MRKLLIILVCYIGRILLSLRYKVIVKGKDLLTKEKLNKKGGILFLPNHPAQMDPIILSLLLWPKFKTRPIAVEYMYRQPGMHFAMKQINAISIPNLETSLNELKLQKVKEVFETISNGLKEKDNFLIYPSARLKHTGKEILGGSSGTYSILKECPEANVVLIRSVGLWGSSFSRALEKKSPNFAKQAFNGIKYLLMNLIFFMPRRRIEIEILPNPEDFPEQASKLELNKYLENWYNRYPMENKVVATEPMKLVSYTFWKKTYPKVIEKKEYKEEFNENFFSSEIQKEIVKELSRISHFSINEINPKMNLALDLGLDSLDLTELITFLSVHYETKEIHPEDIETVKDLVEIAEGKKTTKKKHEPASQFTWPKEEKRMPPDLPKGKTIHESFFRICDKMKNSYACADDLVGPLTYKKLKIAVLLLANEIKKMPGKHISVLLPASCGAYMVTLAILLADKIPVMLNWTLGRRFLDHMIQKTDSEVVISSWKFMEKLTNVEFGDLTKKIVFLEDIKKKITSLKKVKGLLSSLKSSKNLLKKLKLDKVDEEDTAVILFTSGTEAEPKGVPLSHKNIISNLRSALQCINLKADEMMYGILPPFHSFGFSVTGLFPILAGIRVVYFPDPTDSYALAEGIKRWNITMICSAPSFLKGLLQAGTKEELKSLRLLVTGAEKTPNDLYEKVKSLGGNKNLIEGYGITECSPIICLSRANLPRKGVGQIIPEFEMCTVDPETHEPLKKGKEGELCVRGPSVFNGYLGKQKDPFIIIDNKKWYCTGDLGYIDDKGYVVLSGRLKRFTKIGGEMISLGGLEEVINHYLMEKHMIEQDGPQIAVLAKESDENRAHLIVVSTVDIDKHEINQMLKDTGFSRIAKISDVKQIDQIPLTGTGKIDYRYLQGWIE